MSTTHFFRQFLFCAVVATCWCFHFRLNAQDVVVGDVSRQQANEMISTAQKLADSGQLKLAISLQRQAILALVDSVGENDPTVQLHIFRLGTFLIDDEKHSEGVRLLLDLLKTLDAMDSPDLVAVVAIRAKLGSALVDLHRVEEARKMLQATLDIAKKAYRNDLMKYLHYATVAAYDFHRMRDAQMSERLNREIVAVASELPDCPKRFLAGSHKSLATILIENNKNGEARLELDRAIEVARNAGESCEIILAVCLNELATLLHGQADFESASQNYRDAVLLLRKLQPEGSMKCAVALSNYGQSLIAQGKLAEGMDRLFESVDMATKYRSESWLDYADALRNASSGAFALKRYEYAMLAATEACKVFEAFAGENDHRTGRALYNVGLSSMFLGEGPSEESFRSAIKVLDAALLPESQELSDAHEGIGIYFAGKDNRNEALRHFEYCIKYACRRLQTVLPTIPDAEKAVYVDYNLRHLAPVWTFALDNADNQEIAQSSVEWLTNYKWLGYESSARQTLIQKLTKESKLATKMMELRNAIAACAMFVPSVDERAEHRRRYAELSHELSVVTRKLGTEFGNSTTVVPWQSLADLQQSIPDNAVFVDILRFVPTKFDNATRAVVVAPSHYVAWIVSSQKHQTVRVVDLGEAEAIDAQVLEIRHRFQETSDRKEIDRLGGEDAVATKLNLQLRELANQIYAPIAPFLNGKEQLLLSPDKSLWLAPWSALPVDDKGTVLLEKVAIRFVNCGRQLVSPIGTPITNSCFVVGDPAFDAEVFTDRANSKNIPGKSLSLGRYWQMPFQPLRGRSSEPSEIASILSVNKKLSTNLLLDAQANEREILKIVSPRVLCFVTHGVFLADPPQVTVNDPVPMLQGDTRSKSMMRMAPVQSEVDPSMNPLLRCGLILAGGNRSKTSSSSLDDGILTGLEVLNMDLKGTEVVVLAACDSAVGEIPNGEGVSGLQQAFHLAGARYVVGTLWSVDDLETQILTKQFFQRLVAGDAPPDALRNAQLQWIRDRRANIGTPHPAFWSGLTISGH